MFTGDLQRKYAPELDFRGTISTKPISQWRMTFNAVRPFTPDTPANPFIVLIMGGLKASHPEFDPSHYLTAYGMELFQKTLATDCYSSIAEQAAGKKSQDLPVRRHAEPIFLAQGTADTVVFGPATTVTADQLRAVGNDLTFKVYPGSTTTV